MIWRNIKAIAWREVTMILGDRNILAVILLAPVVYALFLGTIFLRKQESDIPIVVVDNDRTELSRTLVRSLDASQTLAVIETNSDFEPAREAIFSGKAQAIINIPENFEQSLKSGQATDLEAYLNTARFLPSNDINKAVSEIALTMAAGVRLKYFQTKGYSGAEAKTLVQPLNGDIRPLFNTNESYGEFLLPGLLMVIFQQTLLFGLAIGIAGEREKKSISQLLNGSANNAWTALFGKGLPYFALYSSYAVFTLIVFFWFFHLNMLGNVTALAALMAIYLVAIIGFGIFIASFFTRQINALQFMVFSSMPLFLLSGYSWPVWSMPLPLRIITQFLPGTPFLLAYIRVTQMGAGWNQIVIELGQLVLLSSLWLYLAQWRLKKAAEIKQAAELLK
jgi:ABC-2 type transport system permease protein